MANWIKQVKIKHLFTENEDYESLQKSMNEIAKVLKLHSEFDELDYEEFNNLPCNRTLAVVNDILDDVYNIADFNKIWIE